MCYIFVRIKTADMNAAYYVGSYNNGKGGREEGSFSLGEGGLGRGMGRGRRQRVG